MTEMFDGVWRLIKRKRPQTYDVSTSPKFRPLQMKKQLLKTKETSELDLKIGEFFCQLFLKIGVCFQKLEFVFENRSLFSKSGVCFRKPEFAF